MSNSKGWLGTVLSLAKECKGKLIFSVICALIGVAGGIVPYVSAYKIIISFYDNTISKELITKWSLICMLGFVVKIVFNAISTGFSHVSAYSILENIRKGIADKYMKAPLGVVQDNSAGTIKSIVVDQVEQIEIPLAHIIPEGTASFILPLVIFIYLCIIDYKLALASIISIPLALIPYGIMYRGYNKTYIKYMKSNEYMNSVLIEYIEGIEVVKAFNQSTSSYAKYSNAVESFKNTTLNWFKSTWKYTTLGAAILPATLLGILPIGTILYMSGSAQLPEITMSMLLSMGMVGSLSKFIEFANTIKAIQYSISSLNETVNIDELPQSSSKKEIENYSIELKNVEFSYTDNDKVIDNVSLKIPENSFTALVGPSGGGKSTLARLISRFWDTSSGDIYIGNVNIKDMPLSQLSDTVSFVTQDNFLFNTSIMENIRLGNPKASDEEVLEAARKAQCHEFVEKLEDGYNSKAGEMGDKLSGGERQRIAIARAILKNAPIVILDEATAFTDPENEAKIQESINELTKGKTLLVIAHRLSTIKNADNIVLIKNGKINCMGKHEELLKNSALYKDMWNAHIGAKEWSVNSEKINHTKNRGGKAC